SAQPRQPENHHDLHPLRSGENDQRGEESFGFRLNLIKRQQTQEGRGKSPPFAFFATCKTSYFLTSSFFTSSFLTTAMASFRSLTPAFEAAIEPVRLSRASPGLWKPSEFSAVQYSHRTWASSCFSL